MLNSPNLYFFKAFRAQRAACRRGQTTQFICGLQKCIHFTHFQELELWSPTQIWVLCENTFLREERNLFAFFPKSSDYHRSAKLYIFIFHWWYFSFLSWWHKTYTNYISKFYGKVDVLLWLLFHLIWKNYVLNWDFDSKSWIVDFFTRFTLEKTPQNNFSR